MNPAQADVSTLIIALPSDFQGFPMGGALSAIRDLLPEVVEESHPVHVEFFGLNAAGEARSSRIEVGGVAGRFQSVYQVSRRYSRPLIPLRVRSLIAFTFIGGWRLAKRRGAAASLTVWAHMPELLPFLWIARVCGARTIYQFHGVESVAAEHSRYRVFRGRRFAILYDQIAVRLVKSSACASWCLDDEARDRYQARVPNLTLIRVLPAHSPLTGGTVQQRVLKLNPPTLLLAQVGRLSAKKRWSHSLDILASLPEHWHLAFAGEGEDRPQLLARAADLGLAHRVHVLGALDPPAVRTLMRQAEGLLMPSAHESLGFVALEAAAEGTPVFATATGCVPALADVACAVVLPAGEPSRWAHEIQARDYDRNTIALSAMTLFNSWHAERRERIRKTVNLLAK